MEQHVKYLRRELKVCEGCGGLWVRTGAEAGVYCRTCSALVADLPGRRRRSPGRPCKIHNAGGTRLQVVTAAATGEQLREPRGRCRRVDAEEQSMEDTAVERRAGMALVALPTNPGAAPIAGSAVRENGVPGRMDGVMASEADAVVTMRKPAGSVVLAEKRLQ